MRNALPILVVAALLPTVLGQSSLPLNAVTNGGFEDGLAGWGVGGALPTLLASGAAGTPMSLYVPDAPCGSFVQQTLPPLLVANDGVYLDFHARIVSGGANPLHNVIETYAPGREPQFTAWVAFMDGQIRFAVWTKSPVAAAVGMPAPTDGAWHHYQVVLVGGAGLGVLLMDGSPVLTATGTPGNVAPAKHLVVGDVAYCNAPAPNVAWDEIYVGPNL